MPYPIGHRDKIRTRIIHSARRLFNRNGFENVSVNQIMAAAGLTRGGFYQYFKSKSDLYVEALSCFFTDPNWKNTWEGVLRSTSMPRLLGRRLFERICLDSISRTSTTLVP
ncbi:MAG TPA: TetR/AcrR family transcriptional regulator [Micropepsaceae bacterium]|nr:TetR/AcrR family transcriptional regulator [Micropepsaceae bacterium]